MGSPKWSCWIEAGGKFVLRYVYNLNEYVEFNYLDTLEAGEM